MDVMDFTQYPAAEALLYGCGLSSDDLKKPIIAVVYSPNDVAPGHCHLEGLAEYVSRGIRDAGGTPRRITAGAGLCDGEAMGHPGMRFSLPSRDTNADAVEQMIKGSGFFSGVVYIGACDKNLPGYLMAAARIDLPSIFVTAGPMMPGNYRGKEIDVVTSFAARAQLQQRIIGPDEYREIISKACPGPGTCAGMFTANTMACVTEALGLTLPGMATTHAEDPEKLNMAYRSGTHIMQLVGEGIKAGYIMTEAAFRNALTLDMGVAGSTNTVLHVPAIASELGIDIDLETIDRISDNTPNIAKLSPMALQDGTIYRMDRFHKAGGVPAAMKALESLLDTETLTVTGLLSRRLEETDEVQSDVIRSIDNPYSENGGIRILKGSLAPKGSVIKTSGIDPSLSNRFVGPATVFDSEDAAVAYINGGGLKGGEVVIIRRVGKAGAPGMPEMLYPTSAISALDKGADVALVTDGRFSGGTVGMCVGHVDDEAYNGGPIALVENGDRIVIDLYRRTVDLEVVEEELRRRRDVWRRPEEDVPLTGALKSFRERYAINL
jgi:dihydroxy-acid dehydratase